MALFNVVAPCVVGGLHYVRPTLQPIEVDDEQAAELVEAGALEPYPKSVLDDPDVRVWLGALIQETGVDVVAQTVTTAAGDESPADPPARRPRKPRAEG